MLPSNLLSITLWNFGLKNAALLGLAAASLVVEACDVAPGLQEPNNTPEITTSPPKPTNNPPRITSNPVTQVDENTAYRYDVNATDDDGDTLIYSLHNNPAWLSINSGTGVISGTAPYATADKRINLEARVSDGKELGVGLKLTIRRPDHVRPRRHRGARLRLDRLLRATTTRPQSGRFAPILVTSGSLARQPLASAFPIVSSAR